MNEVVVTLWSDWPISNFFGTLGMPSIEAPLWTPSCKLKQICTPGFHLFSLYTGELNFGKLYGIKPRCCWERLGGTTVGTHWELDGNKRNKTKKSLFPPPLPKRKKLDRSWVHVEPSHWLHEISISKTVGHHFWPGLMAYAEIWGHSHFFMTLMIFFFALALGGETVPN
jgi:hypothetical protein